MAGIGELKHGFFTGEALWDLERHRFDTSRDRVGVSHLSAVFGLVEMVTEALELIDEPAFEQAWHEYCRLYLAAPEEQAEVFGAPLGGKIGRASCRESAESEEGGVEGGERRGRAG